MHASEERIRGEQDEGAAARGAQEPPAGRRHAFRELVGLAHGIGHRGGQVQKRLLLVVVRRPEDDLRCRDDAQPPAHVGERARRGERGGRQDDRPPVLEQLFPEHVRHLDRRRVQGGAAAVPVALHPVDGVGNPLFQEGRQPLSQVARPRAERQEGRRLVRARHARSFFQGRFEIEERRAQPVGEDACLAQAHEERR